jgi:hypothetical protein
MKSVSLMKLNSLLVMMVFLFSGCVSISYVEKKNGQYRIRALSEKERTGDLSIRGKFPAYNTSQISDRAKFFLVAASSDTANFLEEVVEQRQIILSLGYDPDEIVCYYVAPTAREFERDREQFESLSGEVDSFYLASIHNLSRHLAQAAGGNSPFLYLYATSHGGEPKGDSLRSYYRRKYSHSKEPQRQLDFLTEKYPEYYSQYFIEFDATASGRANQVMQLHELENSRSPEKIILTPRYLKKMLSAIKPEVKKYIVLQGCYTGSFITKGEKAPEQDTLTSIPNICLITASRYDRPSFGCAPGNERTDFGGTYNDALRLKKLRLENMAWKEFYENIKDKIDKIESERKIKPARRSLPAFFNNIRLEEA